MNNCHYEDQLEINDAVIAEFDYEIIPNDVIESSNHHVLLKQASVFKERGELELAKLCHLLGSICSMMMIPKSLNSPYDSYMIMGDKRTPNLDDITDNDLIIISKLLPYIKIISLKGRLADILWLLSKPRNIENARLAIDCYMSFEINSDTWKAGVDDYWERAARLAIQLRGGAGDRLKKIEGSIIKSIDSLVGESQFMFLWLARFLDELGLADIESERIATKSLDHGKTFLSKSNYHAARSYLEFSVGKFKQLGDDTAWLNALLSIAASWEQEGDDRSSSSNMVAATFYENAVQSYRRVPVKYRKENKVEESISRLRLKLKDSGKGALDEMALIKIPGEDVSDIVEASKKHVSGIEKVELAFLYFCGVSNSIAKKESLEFAKQSLSESTLSGLFSNIQLAHDGRVIAKSGIRDTDEDSRIRDEAIRNLDFSLEIKVKAQIIPALHVLLDEHRVSYEMLRVLCLQAPIVPESRERLLAKALYAGFEFDFSSAVHLLTPQIEHMVRTILKDSDVHTSTLNAEGIDMECGLSTLLDKPEAAEIFDEDLLFELQIILADQKGPNLRNDVAHGLLDDSTSASLASVYIWWRVFKLVISSICMPKEES
tara:strand:+ start:96 stop:1904 length:1809 start_codon:yes stop_codon:yes gene_type:complete